MRGRSTLLVPCDDLGSPGDVDVAADLPDEVPADARLNDGPWSSSSRSSPPTQALAARGGAPASAA